jgi:hypothetical protein
MRFQAPLDCITPECVASKRLTVQPGDIILNSLQVLEDVGQRHGRIMLRRHVDGLG